jgi:exo-beta-1,3-glucanase (GH17 family)
MRVIQMGGITRRNFVKGSTATAAAIALGNDTPVAGQSAKPLSGLCYSPYRDGQNPNWGPYPTIDQIAEDLRILQPATERIRTFGVDRSLKEIPRLCSQYGYESYPGAWISKDDSANQQSLQQLIQVGPQQSVKLLIVGSEALFRADITDLNQLIGYVKQVRNATGLPVSTAEPWHIWQYNPSLVDNSDAILANIHPYWEGISISGAAWYVIDKVNQLRQSYPNKKIIVSETGWPSAESAIPEKLPRAEITGWPKYSRELGISKDVASADNQKKFIEDFVKIAWQNNVDYFLFEAFDEAWKTGSAVEAHWGLLYSDGRPKPAMQSVATFSGTRTSQQSKSPAADQTGCVVATAVYGSYEHPKVRIIRHFRDNDLERIPLGQKFIEWYYSGHGMRTANFVKEKIPSAIPAIRLVLDGGVAAYKRIKKL